MRLSDKESPTNTGDVSSALGSVRSPGVGHGNPLQSSCLENSSGQRHVEGHLHTEEYEVHGMQGGGHDCAPVWAG